MCFGEMNHKVCCTRPRVLTGSLYWFLGAPLTKHHHGGGLEQQKRIDLQFFRPRVQSQGFSSVMFLLRALGKKLLQDSHVVSGSRRFFFWLVGNCPLPVCLHVTFPLCVRTPVTMHEGPPHDFILIWIKSSEALFPNKVIFWGTRGSDFIFLHLLCGGEKRV